MAEDRRETEARQNSEDVSAGVVLASGGSIAALIAIALGVSACVVQWKSEADSQADLRTGLEAGELRAFDPADPGVRPNQAFDRIRFETGRRKLLGSYGWQDRPRRIARIPIDRAIEIVAENDFEVPWPEQALDDRQVDDAETMKTP
jgi:hypothetical protein